MTVHIGAEKGEIAEKGTHDQLIAKNGLYAEMWSRQQDSLQN